MSIVTISRDAYSQGKIIAENVADRLGYDCVGPELVKRASVEFSVPESVVMNAVDNSPAKHAAGSELRRNLAMFRSAFFREMKRDDIVYHGMAGHVFLNEVPNVLNIRLLAGTEQRIQERMRRTGEDYVTARKKLTHEDHQRLTWAESAYGKSAESPEVYDMTVNLKLFNHDVATRIIAEAATVSAGGAVGDMQSRLSDLLLEAQIEVRLLEIFPEVDAEVVDGCACVAVEASIVQEAAVARRAREVLQNIDGLKELHVGCAASPFVPF